VGLGPSLHIRQSQQLVLTPQLRQAIQLLQLSNLELDAYLAEELAKNPLLEARPDAGPVARQIGDRTQGPDAGGNRPDAGTQRPIEYREVPGARNCDRTLAASDR